MSNKNKPAPLPEVAPELVYRLTRRGGGVVLEECEATVTRVLRKKPPDALAIVLARLSGWVEERFSR